MSREKHFEEIEAHIRTSGGSDDSASQKLRELIAKAAEGLPIDHYTAEMISALEAEYEIFLASALLYGRKDPALNELRGQLLARYAKLRGWLLIVESRMGEEASKGKAESA